jgi:Acetyl-CoA acetyltransferase
LNLYNIILCINLNLQVSIIRTRFFCFIQEIILGDADIVLAGGSENMSQAPFAVRNARFGINLGEGRQVKFYRYYNYR